MKILIKILPILILFSITIYSCNDDRLTALEVGQIPPKDTTIVTKNPFKDISSQFVNNDKITFTSQYKIDSSNKKPKTPAESNNFSKNRTFFSLGQAKLLNESDMEVDYPYDIKFIEILKRKEMIILDIPTQSGDKVLETAGALYISVTKNGQILKPNPKNLPTIILRRPQMYPTDLKVFYGNNETPFDWFEGSDKDYRNFGVSVSGNLTEYSFGVIPSKFGFINVDRFLNKDLKLTSLQLNTNMKPENYKAYIIFDNIFSAVKMSGGKISNIPENEPAVIFAMAQAKTGEIYSFNKKITTTKNLVINEELKPSSAAEIEKFLNTIN